MQPALPLLPLPLSSWMALPLTLSSRLLGRQQRLDKAERYGDTMDTDKQLKRDLQEAQGAEYSTDLRGTPASQHVLVEVPLALYCLA